MAVGIMVSSMKYPARVDARNAGLERPAMVSTMTIIVYNLQICNPYTKLGYYLFRAYRSRGRSRSKIKFLLSFIFRGPFPKIISYGEQIFVAMATVDLLCL